MFWQALHLFTAVLGWLLAIHSSLTDDTQGLVAGFGIIITSMLHRMLDRLEPR